MAGTRDRIVTATTELFRCRGFNGTSLKDVTTAARATTGSVYHFFPGGKADLAEAVITESGAAYQRLFEGIADETGDPAEAISAFFDGAAAVLEETDFVDICPIGTVAGEIASSDEALRLAADRVFSGWIGAAADRLRGSDVPGSDAEPLATAVVAALQGGFLLARCRRDAEVLRMIGRQMRELAVGHLSAVPSRHVP